MLECWFSEKTPIGIGYDLVKTKFQSESRKERNRIRSGENQTPIEIENGMELDTIWWQSNSNRNRKRNGIWIRSGDSQTPIGIENGTELDTIWWQSNSNWNQKRNGIWKRKQFTAKLLRLSNKSCLIRFRSIAQLRNIPFKVSWIFKSLDG